MENVLKVEYLKALQNCAQVASQQAELLTKKLPILKENLLKSSVMIKDLYQLANIHYDFQNENFIEKTEKLSSVLNDQLLKELEDLIESLDEKKNTLEHFTVTLFGRTKAGKSTIHQTLTKGDGKTIGKGAQRTTREIIEYDWNHLRVIDTPGIGAFNGKADIEIAHSVIDRSDLILFLVTNDSIQKEEFEKLAYLRNINKPIIILLNIKKDLDNKVRRKQFLKNWQKEVSLEGQAGHVERIRQFTKDAWGIVDIPIVPIHAHAAFLSTHTDEFEEQNCLYEASQIDQVQKKLSEIVINEGVQLRIKTFRDSYIHHLSKIYAVFQEYNKQFKMSSKKLNKEFISVQQWFKQFERTSIKGLKRTIESGFDNFRKEINLFIESSVTKEVPNLEKEWKKLIEKETSSIYRVIEEQIEQSKDEISNRLEHISSRINYNIIQCENFKINELKLEKIEKGNLGRFLNFAPLLILAKKIPGPVGVVANAIGIVASVGKLFYGSDEKHYQNKLKDYKEKIYKELKKIEEETIKDVTTLFTEEVINNISIDLYGQVIVALQEIEQLIERLQQIENDVGHTMERENEQLFVELYYHTYHEDASPYIKRIVRKQGYLTKLLHQPEQQLFSMERCIRMEQLLGEKFVAISHSLNEKELIKNSFEPEHIEEDDFSVDSERRSVIVHGKSIFNEVNILLTEQLIDYSIILKGEKSSERIKN